MIELRMNSSKRRFQAVTVLQKVDIMRESRSSPVVQYQTRARSLWRTVMVFLCLVFALQWAWRQACGTTIEHWVIDFATVGTAAHVVNILTPEVQARAVGSRISAAGGGLNILNGCEGTEVLFLLIAALLAYPLSWKTRLWGSLVGVVMVFVANQLRILALFYSFRFDRTLFDHLHGLVAPLCLIAVTSGFFVVLMRWDERLKTAENRQT